MSKWLLPVIALLGVGTTLWAVRAPGGPAVPGTPTESPATPAASPFARTVSGSGLVEPSTEVIAVGTALAGVVEAVFVESGQVVGAGDPLFRVDSRQLAAQVDARRAEVAAAESALSRLRRLPWSADLPVAEASLAEAEAQAVDAVRQLERARLLVRDQALSTEVLEARERDAASAAARRDRAAAELERLRQGAWEADIAVAEANLESARAALAAAEVELDRATVRAPIAGTVLSRTARVGQYAAPGAAEPPLVRLGETRTLHVRVDVDENDAWRVRSGAAARGFLRGNPELSTPLRFIRIEPFVVPKTSLTGAGSERVDTRVLQVVYAFDPDEFAAYAGQIVDVRIEAADLTEGARR
ncbi:MAG: efflux RND transporter periplasmic adaptor subunit [Candidatus Sumerlaeia bacterium]|nr:efflux RND transporter periplasmic adaptor subunit [Candidatus Sumerlaeia bacterium]